jgi:hypothetical protein
MAEFFPPTGVTPLGLVEPVTLKPLPPPPVIRADKINYQTQAFSSVSQDVDPIDAAVVEAIWRVRRSGAAVLNKGTRYLDLKKIDEQTQNLVTSDTRRALSRLVARGYITILKITVTTDNADNWAEVVVDYINNRTSKEDQQRRAARRLAEEIGR